MPVKPINILTMFSKLPLSGGHNSNQNKSDTLKRAIILTMYFICHQDVRADKSVYFKHGHKVKFSRRKIQFTTQ